MAKHMPLSIFRHRPSAQVAPLQSLTLSVDIYNLTLAIIEVKHFYLSARHQSLDTLLPVKYYNLKYEISQRYPSLVVNNGVHGHLLRQSRLVAQRKLNFSWHFILHDGNITTASLSGW